MRILKLALPLCVILVISVSAVSASADTATIDGQPFITDGRMNGGDIGSPAVVYCKFNDDTHSIFEGIEVLRVTPENTGVLALYASAEDIDNIGDSPATDTLITRQNGYSLYRAHSGEFYLVAPADREGKGYSFVWERGDLNC
ncbi:MAG: hypothetical protein K8I30_06635 [Anaerolineae bacterium]|nr:hypothetical protein [Anaerolineae bacterium]